MPEHACGAFYSEGVRTCPGCGLEIDPAGHDPTIQDQRRTVLDNADLRQKNKDLTARAEQSESERAAAEEETARHRKALEELAIEVELMRDEQRALRERTLQLGDHLRLIEARLESLNVSTHRPFSATQTQLFGPDTGAAAAKRDDDQA